MIRLPYKPDAVELLFELCPEKKSVFRINPTVPKVYTFQFERRITEVFFRNFKLKQTKSSLAGEHPLLGDKKYVFEKESLGADGKDG